MMAIGTEFDSYNAFLAVFDSFQVESQLKYSVGTSRLLKSTAENPIEPHVIERFKYAYRRYKCTKCTAGLSLKLIEINGNYKLRISAFQVTHEHEQDPLHLDGRAHLYENLDAIKDIVSKMPKENVPFAEHMIENLLHILKNCPENYVAEQYIKTENSANDNNNNIPQPTATASKCKDSEDDFSVDVAELDDKSEIVVDNELNNNANIGSNDGNFSEGQMDQESANYSTELTEIKPERMWADGIAVNREPSVHIVDTMQQSESDLEVWSVAANLNNSNSFARNNLTESNERCHVLNDREGIDSLNLSSEPNHECNSPSVAGTQHEDQSPLLRYREAVQQNPVRPSGCTTTPKSRLALRRHNANPIVLVSPVQNKTVAYRRALPIESDSDDDSRGQTKSYNTKLTHVGRKIIKNAKENGQRILKLPYIGLIPKSRGRKEPISQADRTKPKKDVRMEEFDSSEMFDSLESL